MYIILVIWIIAVELKLPIILITSTLFQVNKKNLLSLTKPTKSYIFIKCSANSKNVPNRYSVIVNSNYYIENNLLSDTISENIENNWIDLDEYIYNFKHIIKQLQLKK